MLKDITIGQYFPGTTPIHKMDPRTKILSVILYIVALFTCKGIVAYALTLVYLVAAVRISKIKLKTILKGVKPVIFIIVFTAILNMFYTQGNVLVQVWKFKITDNGIRNAVLMVARIIMLITGTFLLTYTTSPITLTDGLERLLGPLKKLHVPVHELAMMMSIALRRAGNGNGMPLLHRRRRQNPDDAAGMAEAGHHWTVCGNHSALCGNCTAAIRSVGGTPCAILP